MLTALFGLLLQVQATGLPAGLEELQGPWRARTGDDASWSAARLDDSSWELVEVPEAVTVRPDEPGGNYRWYRITIRVSAPPPAPLGILFQGVSSAFEAFVDGRPIGGLGTFPPNYRARQDVPAVILLPPEAHLPGVHTLAVRVYSGRGDVGIIGQVRVGPYSELTARERRLDYYLVGAALLLAGLGLAQVVFWMRRPHATEHLQIFVFTLALGLFFVTWMPSIRSAMAPTVHWYRPFFATAAAAAAAFCYLMRRVADSEGEPRDWMLRLLGLVLVVMVPVFLLAPDLHDVTTGGKYILSPALVLAVLGGLWVVLRLHRRDHLEGQVLLWGTVALAVAVAHDVLGFWGVGIQRPGVRWVTLPGSLIFAIALTMTTAQKFVQSETAALYDRLTGLYRREVVMDALNREIRRAARVRQPLAVIMLDVDRFKQINDSLGHQAGDRVLAEVGRRMSEAGRVVDWLGRYGGEEFIALLASTTKGGALLAAERLRHAVAALPIETGKGARTITMSAGVAAFEGGDVWPTTEELVGAADTALYRAKENGRDRVEG